MHYQHDKEILDTFVMECQDHLQDIEDGILELEKREFKGVEDIIHNMFRAAHSIKAGANLLEFANVETVAHALEDYLDNVRHGIIQMDGDQVTLFLKGVDRLAELVENLEKSDLVDVSPLIERFKKRLH